MMIEKLLVKVRRVTWDGLAESIELPQAEAQELIAAAAAIPILAPPDEPPGNQPLGAAILHRLEHDPELAGLMTTANAYANRPRRPDPDPIRRRSCDAWRRYVERILFVGIPRLVMPADFTRAAVNAEFASRPSFSRAFDARAVLIAHLIRRRRCEILAEAFDDLREGRQAAIAFTVGGKGEPAAVPAPTWSLPVLLFDRFDNAVLAAGKTPLFVGVVVGVEASRPPRPLPGAVARRALARLDTELAANGRRFSTAEAVLVLRLALPDYCISERQVTKLLREIKPAAWANGGRRSASVIPTAGELDAAGGAVAGTCP